MANSKSNNSNNTRVTLSPARNTRSPPARAKTPISSMINSAFNRLSLALRSPERAKKHVRRKLEYASESLRKNQNAARTAQNLNKKRKEAIRKNQNAARTAQNLNKKRKEAIRTSLNAIKKAKEAQKKSKNKNTSKK